MSPRIAHSQTFTNVTDIEDHAFNQLASYKEMREGQDPQGGFFATGHTMPVVAKCGGFGPYLSLILLIASWWSHSAHTWPLWTSCWGGSLGLPAVFLAAYDAICGSLVFGSIPHGPELAESISTSGVLQQHRSCNSCCNTAIAGMHSLVAWLLGPLDTRLKLCIAVLLGSLHFATHTAQPQPSTQ